MNIMRKTRKGRVRPPVTRLAFTFQEWASANAISRAQAYKELAAGNIQTYLIGRLRFVSARAAEEYVARKEREGAPVAA